VHLYYDFALQVRRFRVVLKRVLGLGLIVMHFSYDFILQGMRFRVA
jgi:hypothetical protein